MSWLDCHDLDQALASLASAIGTTPADLGRALLEHDESRFEEAAEEPWQLMPREVLEHFDTDAATVVGGFEGAYYFHGTRAIDPEAFWRRGILPLDQMLDELWATLRELVSDIVSGAEWDGLRGSVEADACGHDGYLYRLKTRGRIHFGPFGLVVRETFFQPGSTGSHDYLGCPEIVQDIARCFSSARGVNLERRFCDTTYPCIIKFRSMQLRSGAINAALWYVYTKLRDGEIRSNSNYSFDGEGEPVPAADIVDVEIVSTV